MNEWKKAYCSIDKEITWFVETEYGDWICGKCQGKINDEMMKEYEKGKV